jgi:hypothetical protein
MKKLKNEQAWKWAMSFVFLASALTISSNFEYSKYGYFMFGLGHIMGMHVFWRYKDHAMFFHNCLFLLIDLWGIYRWMF